MKLPQRTQRSRGRRGNQRSLLSVFLCVLCTSASSAAKCQFTRADTASLRKSLNAIANSHRGVLGYSIDNIDTGERLSLRGDETFPTASLIKVPILVTLYDLAAQNQLSLEDPITVLKIDQ